MHGVAKGVEDCRDVFIHMGTVAPDVAHRQTDVFGKCTRAVDADALGIGAQVPPASQAVPATAAHDVPLAADDLPDVKVGDVGAHRADLTDELVSDHQRSNDGGARPGVPFVDVQVCAADAGPVHADQHIVDAGLGHR